MENDAVSSCPGWQELCRAKPVGIPLRLSVARLLGAPGGEEWTNAITHLRDADRPGPSRDKTFQSGLEWSSRQDPDVWHIKSALTKQTNKKIIKGSLPYMAHVAVLDYPSNEQLLCGIDLKRFQGHNILKQWQSVS